MGLEDRAELRQAVWLERVPSRSSHITIVQLLVLVLVQADPARLSVVVVRVEL